MSSNEKKNATLGMSHGTAAGKLRKMILFSLLQKYGDDNCFRCGKKIQLIGELSIEHKQPWEGISAELFWDLENISFSHVACNRPHRNPGPKIVVGEGMAWCSRHQEPLPIDQFYRKSRKSRKGSGCDPYCKACRVETDNRQNHAKKSFGE